MRGMAQPSADKFTFVGDGVWMSEFRLGPSHPAWQISRSTTDDVFLIAFPRATVAIRHEHRHEVVADPLTAVAYSPGQPYRRRLISPRGDDSTIVAFCRGLVAEAAREFEPGADPATYRLPFAATTLSRAAHARLERLRRTSGADRDALSEELLGLLGHVVRMGYGSYVAQPGGRPSSRHVEIAQAVREILGRDLLAPLSLGEIASELAISPFHLVRIFRTVTGRPIHAHLTELRLRSSLPLIADGMRLADVAQQVGFASHAHLTHRFGRAYGMAPATWREMSKNVKARAEDAFVG
jgi:AraC-like DNA-binding protein